MIRKITDLKYIVYTKSQYEKSDSSFMIGHGDEFINLKDTSDAVIHNFNMDLDNNNIKIISADENMDLEVIFDRCNN